MGEATAAIDIDRGPDTVWAAIGDFGGIGDWMPGIESCRVEGENRILAMMGMEITEHLVSKDDAERVLVYSIVDRVPVQRHQGTITVTASQDGSHVTWHVDAAPDDMAQMMGGLYQQALEALKKHVEG